MMGYTDIHFLKLINLLLPGVELYTEMIVAQAFIRMPLVNVKQRAGIVGKLILQLGGSDPELLADCAAKAKLMGYDAVNLNVGCPSSKVVKGRIGAVLMRSPDLVSDCVAAMVRQHATSVKTRIGVDDAVDNLSYFAAQVLAAGCCEIIVHARRAWLNGLDTKQNRTVPPLNYERVCQLKREFPQAVILLNGGLSSEASIKEHIGLVDGFMLGRIFYSDPILVASMAKAIGFKANSFAYVLVKYVEYIEGAGEPSLTRTLRHLSSCFKGFPGSRGVRSQIQSMMQSNRLDKDILLGFSRHLG